MMDPSANRVVFALAPDEISYRRLYTPSKIPVKIGSALVSFYYIDLYSRTSKSKKAVADRMLRIRKNTDVVMIDSGIFTMKTKFLKTRVGASLASLPKEEIARFQKVCLDNYDYFWKFAKSYALWLRRNPELYNWCFDLDVDEFLGLEAAERFYHMLSKVVPDKEKIIRVWHSLSRGFDDWVNWCESGQYVYLGMESPGSHKWDANMYRRMIAVAHKHNIKVHVLACTEPSFFKRVPLDTGDSATWLYEGGRFGIVRTPYGRVSFAMKAEHKRSIPYYRLVPKSKRRDIMEWINGTEHKFRWVDLLRYEVRDFVNIKFFLDEVNRPFSKSGQVYRQSFLD